MRIEVGKVFEIWVGNLYIWFLLYFVVKVSYKLDLELRRGEIDFRF